MSTPMIEPSFVQTINGKPMQFYRAVHRRPNNNSREPLVPYMVATTYSFLCLLLLQLGRKSWPYYIADLVTSFACVALHHFKQPLLAFNLAIGYTVCNLIPGSLATKDLPTHSEFMRNLKVKEPSDSCLICWGDDQSHAELPCGHQFCLPCIKLMTAGEQFKNTCSTCRRPLFNIGERFQMVGRKGNQTFFVLMIARNVIHFSHEIARPRYCMAALAFALIFLQLAVPAYIIYKVWSAGFLDTWWTSKPSAESWNDLRVTGIALFSSAVVVCTSSWSDYQRFD